MNNEQLAVATHEVIASLKDQGIAGLAEHRIVEIIKGLYKSPSNVAHENKLIKSLNHAAEAAVCGTEHPTLASLMVLLTLGRDINTGGEAEPPAGHPSAAAWAGLVPKLRMGLIAALGVYPVMGSEECKTKSDLATAAGALAMMLYPKTKQQQLPVVQLACEAALLRMLQQLPACVEYMRGLEGVLLHSLRDAIAKAPKLSSRELQELGEIEDCGEDEHDEEDEDEDEEDDEDGEEEEEEEEEEEAKPVGKPGKQGSGKRSQPTSRTSNAKKMKR